MKRNKAKIITALSAALLVCSYSHAASDICISEYIEGSSYNKAIELYNDTGASIDLSAYEMQFYFNGSTTAGRTINLSGTIAQGNTFVLAHSQADAAILAQTDQNAGGSWFNGDDAVVLLKGGTVVDAVGQIGVDPGSEWGNGTTSTQNNSLTRNTSVSTGDSDAYNTFDPADEWTGYAENTFDGLGSHASSGGDATTPPPEPSPTGGLLINEVDSDTAGSDTAEFIELYDGGTGNQDLSSHVLVLYNGSNDTVYAAFDLDGYQTDAAGYFVIGNAAVSGVDLVIPNGKIQNGADAVALYQGNAVDFPNGTAVTQTSLIDAVVYDTNDTDDAGLLSLLNTAQPQLNEAANANKDAHSNQRCDNSSEAARNTDSFIQATATPAAANSCTRVTACGSPASLIHSIQGSGSSSPMINQTVTVEAVVTGNFQNTTAGLSGFFIQEESTDADTNTNTSEGLFIHDNGFGINVTAGNVVRVSGTVNEYFGLTELTTITSVEVCSTGTNITPASVALPFSTIDDLERVEGMLVTLPQPLTVTENYNLGRYGEVVVSSSGRLFTPTNVVSPGSAAIAQQAANDLNRLIIDDGSSAQNPDPIAYPGAGLTAFNTLRSGDTISDVTGMVSYTANTWRIHPTQQPQFVAANPRNASPSITGSGNLRVASFNVLNYFNGNGQGGGFPTARGADTASEFTRQRDKIITAITTMNADIIGLMEIENDGYAANSAIQDLINGLNAAAPAGTSYSFINPGVSKIGTDAIAVGLIYRNETVHAIGNAVILDSSVDSRFNDQKNRPTLAQTFAEKAGNGRLTIAVNHLKSKGSSCASIDDPDTGDGQGNCNLTRTRAAEAIVDWLATDPTASGDSDVLIIGDLNAYAKEDPVSTILAGGYNNLIATYEGTGSYSYIFMGQAGNLDHALANSSLASQVIDVIAWNINADEPRVLDYNEEFKTAQQLDSLYNNDAYRASDHDPVVIELNLAP